MSHLAGAWPQSEAGQALSGASATTFAVLRLHQRRRGSQVPAGNAWAKLRELALCALILVPFAFFVLDPMMPGGHSFDLFVAEAALFMTTFGKSGWYLWPLGIGLVASAFLPWRSMRAHALGLWSSRVQLAWYFFLTLGLTETTTSILKQVIGRARPTVAAEFGLFYFEPWTLSFKFASFPSGHSATFGALFAAIACLAPKWRVLCYALALWGASTRAIIGVHWPSDVVAGLIIGVAMAETIAFHLARRRILFRFAADGTRVVKSGFRLV
jgi:membrane-associated phospholipid phosphatase